MLIRQVLCCFIISLVMGLATLPNYAEWAWQRTALQRLSMAVKELDAVFSQARSANMQALSLRYAATCDEQYPLLHELVERTPYVRRITTNLQHVEGVCSSNASALTNAPRERALHLDYNVLSVISTPYNKLSPFAIALTTRTLRGWVEGEIDGLFLMNRLTLPAMLQARLVLQLGDNGINSAGEVKEYKSQTTFPAPVQQHSDLYGYTLHAEPFPAVGGWPLNLGWQYWLIWSVGVLLLSVGLTLGWRHYSAPSSQLFRAYRGQEFVPVYQPIMTSDSDPHMMGVEVLLRRRTQRGHWVMPATFIEPLENCGLIVPVTEQLMMRVADELTTNLAAIPHGFHVSINISAQHLQGHHLLRACQRFLQWFPTGRVVLVLELTEREPLAVTPSVSALLAQLVELGVKLALDDFGTGYSSLSYLQTLPVSYLKIDASFVASINGVGLGIGEQAKTNNAEVLNNIIHMGLRLGLTMIAEGVETELQASYLQEQGVPYQQGFYWQRPTELTALLWGTEDD